VVAIEVPAGRGVLEVMVNVGKEHIAATEFELELGH